MRSKLTLEHFKRVEGDVGVALTDIEVDAFQFLEQHCLVSFRVTPLGGVRGRRIQNCAAKINFAARFRSKSRASFAALKLFIQISKR